MDDYKFRMVEMMHLYLSGMITDEEMQEKIYQIYYEVLKEQAEVGMLYGRAEDVVLHIEKEGRGNYEIRQKDMKKLDGLLIEEVHPIE